MLGKTIHNSFHKNTPSKKIYKEKTPHAWKKQNELGLIKIITNKNLKSVATTWASNLIEIECNNLLLKRKYVFQMTDLKGGRSSLQTEYTTNKIIIVYT